MLEHSRGQQAMTPPQVPLSVQRTFQNYFLGLITQDFCWRGAVGIPPITRGDPAGGQMRSAADTIAPGNHLPLQECPYEEVTTAKNLKRSRSARFAWSGWQTSLVKEYLHHSDVSSVCGLASPSRSWVIFSQPYVSRESLRHACQQDHWPLLTLTLARHGDAGGGSGEALLSYKRQQ